MFRGESLGVWGGGGKLPPRPPTGCSETLLSFIGYSLVGTDSDEVNAPILNTIAQQFSETISAW